MTYKKLICRFGGCRFIYFESMITGSHSRFCKNCNRLFRKHVGGKTWREETPIKPTKELSKGRIKNIDARPVFQSVDRLDRKLGVAIVSSILAIMGSVLLASHAIDCEVHTAGRRESILFVASFGFFVGVYVVFSSYNGSIATNGISKLITSVYPVYIIKIRS